MKRIPRFPQRSLHGLPRRVGEFFRRFVGHRFIPEKRVRRITLNGRDYKRLTLPDTRAAARIAAHLETFHHVGCFPELVAAIDAELLLEFVSGRPLDEPFDDDSIDRIGCFYGALYAVDRRRVPVVETPFLEGLQRDLVFLRDVGVLDANAYRDLAAVAASCAPEFVWIGWDYLDPLPRNFIVTDSGRLVAVDVESLEPDQLLGRGVAKCLHRGGGSARDRLFAAVARQSSLALEPLMPFVELHFLAGWTKHAFLKGRAKLVDPARFDPFRVKVSAAAVAEVTRP